MIIPTKVVTNFLRSQNEAVPNNIFSVMIGGDPIGSFLKVTGIEYSVQPFNIKEGGRNHSAHYRPFEKPGEFTGVELTWGAVNRSMMEAWVHIVSPGYPFRRSV